MYRLQFFLKGKEYTVRRILYDKEDFALKFQIVKISLPKIYTTRTVEKPNVDPLYSSNERTAFEAANRGLKDNITIYCQRERIS